MQEVVFCVIRKGLGFEIFRVAVVKRVIWLVPVYGTFLRLSELNLVKCGKEENGGLGEEGKCQWLYYIIECGLEQRCGMSMVMTYLRHTGYCGLCVVLLGVKRCEVEGTSYDIKGQ